MGNRGLGIALIGTGRAGLIHGRNYAGRVDGARLVAVADANEESVRHAAAEFGLETWHTDYRALLDEPEVDAVVIVTPTSIHRDVAVAAAEAGKHIFCEKPMAMNTAECDEINRAAEAAGVVLQIGFMRRFDRNFVEAKEAVDRGEIGDVVMVRTLTHGPSTPQPWMYDIQQSNGPLAEINSHDIDTVRWFTESEYHHLYAMAGNFRCPEAREQYPDFYDNVVMTGTMENGMQGVVEGAAAVRYGYDSRAEILGTEGILFVGDLADTNVVVSNRQQEMRRNTVKSWRGLFREAYHAEAQGFVEAVRNGTAPRVTGHDGRAAVEVVVAGNQSIVEKRPVSLSDGSDS